MISLKLSVLFPVKDRTKYLPQAIGSVLAGLGELSEDWTLELIVGDNASSRPIEPVVAAIDPSIRVIRHSEDLGIFGNMNALIAESRGDWCHVVHDDDWIMPGFYRRFAAAVAEAPHVQVVSISTRVVDEERGTNRANYPWCDESGMIDGTDLLKKLHSANTLAIVGMLISRQAYHRMGLYREDLHHTGDWDMWQRLARRCPWYFCIENLARFRVHKDTATKRLQQSGQSAVEIRRSIQDARPGMDTWEEYRAGSLNWARMMLRDAQAALIDENPLLARIVSAEAVEILRMFT